MEFPYNVNVMLEYGQDLKGKEHDPDVAEAVHFLEDHVLHQRHVDEHGVIHRGFVPDGGVVQSILELERMLDVDDVRSLRDCYEDGESYTSDVHFHGHDWFSGYLKTENGVLKIEFYDMKPDSILS